MSDLSMLCRSIASRGGAATPAFPLLSVEAPLRVPAGCLSLRAACCSLDARLQPYSPRSRCTGTPAGGRLGDGGGQWQRPCEFPILAPVHFLSIVSCF